MKNLYELLEVSPSAAEAEIKRSYRRLSKRYHPDANPGNRAAEERFKELSEAYAILQDPAKRQEYDESLAGKAGKAGKKSKKRGAKTPGFGSSPDLDFSNMEEQFSQFFGFQPKTGKVDEDKLNKNKKIKANPLDMTEMFDKYMGIKK